MRIIRSIAQILFGVIAILLAISVVRIIVSGNPNSSLSFYTFFEFLQNDLDFDASPFFNEFYQSLINIQDSFAYFSDFTVYNMTGVLALDKILSGVVNLWYFLRDFVIGLMRLIYSPFQLLRVFVDLLKFILDLFKFLFGMEFIIT